MIGRLKRLALGVALVLIGVTLAKISQYAAVDRLGASLGFDLASAIGAIPIIAPFVWLVHRFPHWRGGTRG